jgi:hypothetical protein|tara:strand:+ start:805 stop:1092 length:288 start_codon:yes stop_codon:yes gene_type:complete
MAFKKGESGNIKGKPKGAVNKITQTSRELFLETLEGESEHIAAAFEKVRKDNPRAYLDLFAKYAQYFVPKKTESNDKTEVTVKDFNIKDVFKFND